ncbi:aromatic acid/H+ symport family MFS transporter [Brevibacillus nitrificans]|uniref:MFS transporter n=1 Tax=Brevibacillus nitrificans TaxID=651560 RepID=UPI002E1C3494|nr:aromatic acid/H+ symport family MFS transporter [Brevibacillus nitrificans]
MKAMNATQIVDGSRFNAFHIALIIWGFIIIMFDGYDIVIYGSVVPVLMKEWSLSSVTTGAIGSYATLGTAVGALAFGYLADKIGRKKVIIICTVLFSVFVPLAGMATSPVLFAICRVIAGLGLGGVMPNVIALTTEYAPKVSRAAIVSFVFCGYSIGGILAGLVSRVMIPEMGWRPIFWFAAIPLLLLPFMMKSLPESYGQLLRRGEHGKVSQILGKVNPEFKPTGQDTFEVGQPSKEEKSSISKLFENNRGLSTVMFWLACFSCFILISALNTWLPKLMMETGYDLRSSLTFVMVLNAGAIIGTIIFGRLTDKKGFKIILIPLYVSGALALCAIGLQAPIMIAYLLIAVIGAASIGLQNLLNAYVSQFYPADIRSTGLGVYTAFGRMGGIVAPMLVGILLTMQLTPQMNFVILSIAGLIGAIAISFVKDQRSEIKRQPIIGEDAESSVNL